MYEEIGENLLVVGKYETEKAVSLRVINKDRATLLTEESDGGLDKVGRCCLLARVAPRWW